MDGLRTWWDGVEAWLTGLSFLPQLLVSLAVVIPLAIAAAVVLNMLVNGVLNLFERAGSVERRGEDR